jgi:TM2 domain-containing membrane protein YozV
MSTQGWGDDRGEPTTQPRAPQAQQPAEVGWWQASDGRWYPPETQPGTAVAPALPASAPYPPGAQPKSRVTAGILGILLGGFGVHRFYLGYTGVGIAQIAVTILTCGIGGLWGVIEGILILTRNQNFLTDAYGVPLVD